jgi:hypothetical protein
MRRKFIVAISTLLVASASWADAISPGGTVNTTVYGTSSIYQIFGHAGNPGGDYGPATDAILLTFAAGSGNVFTFSASGYTNCCSGTPTTPVDGGFAATNVTGANGLSNTSGNTQLPLLGVFTTDTDPNGGSAPAALPWDANNPVSLAPLLNQIFYVGDGKSGYMNALGSVLQFTAPGTATRLYLGVSDAYSFNGVTGYYNDNPGSYSVAATLSGAGPVPEPETYAMLLAGLGLLGFTARRRKQKAA